MKNFGEELAYWYLRLNGFFLINDFVLHRADLEEEELKRVQNADADLIGIRNPFTFEKIGMAENNDVCPALQDFEPQIFKKPVAVISEVKSGDSDPGVILLNRVGRLRYIVKRIGLFETEEKIEQVAAHLLENNRYSDENITILKILFSQTNPKAENFYYLPLSHIERQIMSKFLKYKDHKNPSKLFFPSTLMQYLIWKVQENNSNG